MIIFVDDIWAQSFYHVKIKVDWEEVTEDLGLWDLLRGSYPNGYNKGELGTLVLRGIPRKIQRPRTWSKKLEDTVGRISVGISYLAGPTPGELGDHSG